MSNTTITSMTREDLGKMNKNQIIDLLMEAIDKLNERKDQKSNKKYLVLDILKRGTPISILDISNELDISTKNVSSLLSYLRKDGTTIHTDDKGRKYIVE